MTVSTAEAARLLNCSVDTVYRYLKDGHLTGVKISHGRIWRVHRDSVDAFVWVR